MERYTFRDETGKAWIPGSNGCDISCAEQFARYEETCFTPEEISGLMIENGEKAAEITRLNKELARMTEERDAAVADMKIMALAMRESEELSEGCCFACLYDGQNLPDNVILAYGECPGYEANDCFEWRGPQGAGEGGQK